jgi:RNAse (barnase) inhibitor barstar
MAKQEYSKNQKKIISRYYDNLDTIMLTKLQELASEIYLAEGKTKKLDQLWDRVAKAMDNIGVPPDIQAHILAKRSPEILARNIVDWLKQAGKR